MIIGGRGWRRQKALRREATVEPLYSAKLSTPQMTLPEVCEYRIDRSLRQKATAKMSPQPGTVGEGRSFARDERWLRDVMTPEDSDQVAEKYTGPCCQDLSCILAMIITIIPCERRNNKNTHPGHWRSCR